MRRCARRARSRRGSFSALDSSSRAGLVMTEGYHGCSLRVSGLPTGLRSPDALSAQRQR
jgi:hypothetical protein